MIVWDSRQVPTSVSESGDALEAHAHRQRPSKSEGVGGEGGIRTHVPVTRQHAFEARPLRPLRYLSVGGIRVVWTSEYSVRGSTVDRADASL